MSSSEVQRDSCVCVVCTTNTSYKVQNIISRRICSCLKIPCTFMCCGWARVEKGGGGENSWKCSKPKTQAYIYIFIPKKTLNPPQYLNLKTLQSQ